MPLPSWRLKTDKVKGKEGIIKGFVIGATGSGTGKTTISLAILSYLAEQGKKVVPFKVGPDFIDPGHHTRIAGTKSYNLDSWMLSKAYNKRLFQEKSKHADIAVVEGVMGVFDGYDGLSETGSTAQMAKWLNLPVVLVVSAKGKARSAAAIVKGFEDFDPDLKIAGVIFSRIGSLRHYEYLKQAVEQNCRTRCLGFMPQNEAVVMPERHLGLVTADELHIRKEVLSTLRHMVRDHIDMDTLIQNLDTVEIDRSAEPEEWPVQTDDSLPTIAVARDRAFCFYYPDNLEILEKSGARVMEFSPLADNRLPPDIDGIYLGGGYPEVYAETLSRNTALSEQIRHLSRGGMPIYGECGGFMYLCRSLTDMDGIQKYPMCGCFDVDVVMSRQLRSLGYREITLTEDTLIGKKGSVLRGHEFHYSSVDTPDAAVRDVYRVTSRAGQDICLKGYQTASTLGSYLHVHFGSNQPCARHFVDLCRMFKDQKNGLPHA